MTLTARVHKALQNVKLICNDCGTNCLVAYIVGLTGDCIVLIVQWSIYQTSAVLAASQFLPLGMQEAGRGSMGHSDTCVTVTAKPKPVLPEKPVDRYPGPFGHWVRPRNHRGMAIMGRKSNDWRHIASHGCPAREVLLNVRKGAHAVIRHRVCHIPGVYKQLRPNLGESFCSSGNRST